MFWRVKWDDRWMLFVWILAVLLLSLAAVALYLKIE